MFRYYTKLSNQSFGVAELDENGEIVNLIENPRNKSNYSTIGLYKFTDVFIEAFKEISPSKEANMRL